MVRFLSCCTIASTSSCIFVKGEGFGPELWSCNRHWQELLQYWWQVHNLIVVHCCALLCTSALLCHLSRICQGGSGSQRCARWQGWRRATSGDMETSRVMCKEGGPSNAIDVFAFRCTCYIYAAWACHRGSIVFVHNTEVWYHRDPQVVYYQCALSTNLPNCETHGLRSSPSIHPSTYSSICPSMRYKQFFLVHTYCVYIENDRII